MNFCTYFDSYYLVKGLGLYRSLSKVTKDFHLFVMAFDKECYDKLIDLSLENMTVELISDVETDELLAVKPTRSRGEYCWTCGPFVIQYFLKKNNLDCITYLDSDLFFLGNPNIIEEEAKDSSIVITEQKISERAAKLYGRYCVQYLTFRNDVEGQEALSWWKDSCIEWCYQKLEDTRYGDQKYLDEFPKRWKDVHIVRNLGAGIAPWNMGKYHFSDNSLIYKDIEYPLVFFHMHGVKILVSDNVLHLYSLHNPLNKQARLLFYVPYAKTIKDALTSYLGYCISEIHVHNMPINKRLEYKLRSFVRNSRLVRWIWFDLLKIKNYGHGTKL